MDNKKEEEAPAASSIFGLSDFMDEVEKTEAPVEETKADAASVF